MTRWILLITFFSCLAFGAEPSVKASGKAEVSIATKVETSPRENIRLSDIAMVSQPTEELLNVLDNLSFKAKESVSAGEITALVRNEMENNEALKAMNISFKIPSEIQLTKSIAMISKQETERKIVNALQVKCHDCEYHVNVQTVPTPSMGQWDLDLSQLSSKGSFLIPVRDGDAKTLKWISGSVRVIKLTPVATRFIQVGERIQAEDLKMAAIDVTYAKDAGMRLEDIQGQQLVRGIQIGQPIWASDIKRESAAKKGQIVKAILGSDEFEITTNLEAQESGFIGDMIKVKNLETQKVLSAVVTEKGVVKIQ